MMIYTRARLGQRPAGTAGRLRDQRGLSMLEVVVSITLVVIVLLASVGLVTRTVAQVGYARTEQADRAARAKTVASQWLQAQVEYMRSLGFRKLLNIFLDPSAPTTWVPADVAYTRSPDGTVVFREITQGSGRALGETPLPRDFEHGRVTIMVEAVEQVGGTNYLVSVLRVEVELFRASGDTVPFVVGKTSVQRP
jgi:type II secretory pathway pseudopilin PulG